MSPRWLLMVLGLVLAIALVFALSGRTPADSGAVSETVDAEEPSSKEQRQSPPLRPAPEGAEWGTASRQALIDSLKRRQSHTQAGAEESEEARLVAQALDAPEADTRAFAFRNIALKDPNPDLFQACVIGLSDEDEDVRLEAVLALELFGEAAAIPILERVSFNDPSDEVRDAARVAAEELRSQK